MPAAPMIGAPTLIGVLDSRPITESSFREYTTSRAFSGIDSFLDRQRLEGAKARDALLHLLG
jgi:hypothetical protein